MWSVGCILGELLGCIQDQINQKRNTRILFNGHACYPLSPKKADPTCPYRIVDQIEAIIKKVGFPSAADQSFIKEEPTLSYLNKKFANLKSCTSS